VENHSIFLPKATSENSEFVDFFILILYTLTLKCNIKNANYHNVIKSLVHIVSVHPKDGKYLHSFSTVTLAARTLDLIIKSNFDQYNVVEKVIARILCEIERINEPSESLTQMINKEPVKTQQRKELIRVLFRILNHSIFKNDPNLNNFNPNYEPNSRKIIQTELFSKCMEVA